VKHINLHDEMQFCQADLTEEERVVVTRLLDEALQDEKDKLKGQHHHSHWVCVSCRERCNWRDLQYHISQSHGKTGLLLENEDYVLHMDVSLDNVSVQYIESQ